MSARQAETGAGAPQGPDAEFQDRLASGHLWLQTCADCKRAFFHPRILCPHCGSFSVNWVQASGRGTVYSRTVLHRKPRGDDPAPALQGIVLVDLEEGPRMMSSMPDVPPQEVTIGMPVQARIIGAPGALMVVYDRAEEQT